MLPFFAQLGRSLEASWLDVGRDEAVFADLAYRELCRSAVFENVSVAAILDWFFSPCPELAQPSKARFGQPPVMLYQGRDFSIEALFWMTSTTSIHQHSFSGAFTVLHGSSVHTQWRFEPTRRLKSSMHLGRLQIERTEILRAGDARRIRAGRDFIHQLFHLDSPSVSIVVRTRVEKDHLPQLSYLPPGLAMDGFREDGVIERQLALLGLMMDSAGRLDGQCEAKLSPSQAAERPVMRAAGSSMAGKVEQYAARILDQGDGEAVYRVLSCLIGHGIEPDMLARLIAHARRKHGEVIDDLHAAAQSQRRIALIGQLRDTVVARDQRLLLALLMLLPNKNSILDVIAAEYPGCDAADRVLDWACQLSEVGDVGVEFDELNTTLFRAMLDGCDEKGLVERLSAEYDRRDVEAMKPAIMEQAGKLARSEIFAPLFVDSPLATEPDANAVSPRLSGVTAHNELNAASAQQFRHHKYLVVEGAVEDPLLAIVYRYALRRALVGQGCSDTQVPGTPSFDVDILMETLLEVATATVEELTGLDLDPTYSYLRIYTHGDVLPRHRDRPACEISMTLCLGLDPGSAGADYRWPLLVQGEENGEEVAIPCQPGDGIIYRGCDVWHRREAFAGVHQAQVFLHYVDRHGPHASLKWDGRPGLGMPREPRKRRS
ncbi:MAG: hypothetical protein MJE77_03215 [Proteobacteria bacterium]|nr:hypothetical protein [Pseudomonadota bacterium]